MPADGLQIISASISGATLLTLLGLVYKFGRFTSKVNGHLNDKTNHHTMEKLQDKFVTCREFKTFKEQ